MKARALLSNLIVPVEKSDCCGACCVFLELQWQEGPGKWVLKSRSSTLKTKESVKTAGIHFMRPSWKESTGGVFAQERPFWGNWLAEWISLQPTEAAIAAAQSFSLVQGQAPHHSWLHICTLEGVLNTRQSQSEERHKHSTKKHHLLHCVFYTKQSSGCD